MNAKDALGQLGEQLAVEYLEEAGLKVLDRNWRCQEGEVDIVLTDGRALVVCEVKTRSSTRFGNPVEAVGRTKLQRLRRLAVLWLADRGALYDEVRVDVVGVLRDRAGNVHIDHVRGVG